MTHAEFEKVLSQRIEKIKRILTSKAKEYATDDRLHNFKRSARFMNLSTEKVCWSFLMKHLTSIADLVDNAEDKSLPPNHMRLVDEKIGDAINYLVLLEAIFTANHGKTK